VKARWVLRLKKTQIPPLLLPSSATLRRRKTAILVYELGTRPAIFGAAYLDATRWMPPNGHELLEQFGLRLREEATVSNIEIDLKGVEIGEVTLEFVRRYIAVLRNEETSADDCWRLLLARAKAKELLDASAYDSAVEIAQSFGGSAR
jgi:hypothetical protein